MPKMLNSLALLAMLSVVVAQGFGELLMLAGISRGSLGRRRRRRNHDHDQPETALLQFCAWHDLPLSFRGFGTAVVSVVKMQFKP